MRVLAFLPRQRRQSVRAANENRGARRDDLLGTLDIADFVIDQRPVACLLWVISGCAGQTAARQVNPNKRTPELEQTYLAVRHPLAG